MSRGPSELWRAARGPLVLTLIVLVAATLLALTQRTRGTGALDPREAQPEGSRALAEVLRDRGVQVDLFRSAAAIQAVARPGDTVLVAWPALLVDSQVEGLLETGADLVVVEEGEPGRFVPGITVAESDGDGGQYPGCQLPAAQRAGNIDAAAFVYAVDRTALHREIDDAEIQLCYRDDIRAALVQVRTDGRLITLLANSDVLTNDRLDDRGHAALAMGLLGAQPRLLWYLPSLADLPEDEARTIYDWVPLGVWWGLAQLSIGVLLLALWRARRLGPVVTEPLPVIVRATETVEGRAGLYRRARARDRAAESLRSATIAELVPLLGLPRAAEPTTVVDAVAARTRRPALDVAALLYGGTPVDDVALVRLADELDVLEREVRRP